VIGPFRSPRRALDRPPESLRCPPATRSVAVDCTADQLRLFEPELHFCARRAFRRRDKMSPDIRSHRSHNNATTSAGRFGVEETNAAIHGERVSEFDDAAKDFISGTMCSFSKRIASSRETTQGRFDVFAHK
jgi:hypothetical protein